MWLYRINGVPGPRGLPFRAVGTRSGLRPHRARLWGVGAPPRVCVYWGELCPIYTPPLRCLPALGREVFVAPLRHRPRAAPGSARGNLAVRGAATRALSLTAGRRNLGGRVAARYRARPGGGTGGRRLRGAGRVVVPAAPAACSDRLGSAAACGARALAEALYPAVLFVGSAPQAMFSSLLGRNVRLVS